MDLMCDCVMASCKAVFPKFRRRIVIVISSIFQIENIMFSLFLKKSLNNSFSVVKKSLNNSAGLNQTFRQSRLSGDASLHSDGLEELYNTRHPIKTLQNRIFNVLYKTGHNNTRQAGQRCLFQHKGKMGGCWDLDCLSPVVAQCPDLYISSSCPDAKIMKCLKNIPGDLS